MDSNNLDDDSSHDSFGLGLNIDESLKETKGLLKDTSPLLTESMPGRSRRDTNITEPSDCYGSGQAVMSRSSSMVSLAHSNRASIGVASGNSDRPIGRSASTTGLPTLVEMAARPMQRRPSRTFLRGGLSRSTSFASVASRQSSFVDGSFGEGLGYNTMDSSLHSVDISTHRPSYLLSEKPSGLAVGSIKPLSRSGSIVSLPTLAEKGESQKSNGRPKLMVPREPSDQNQPITTIETSVQLLSDSHNRKDSNSSIDQFRKSPSNSLGRSSSTLAKAVSMLNLKKQDKSSENYHELVRRRKKENASTKDGLPSYGFLEKDKKIDQGSLLPTAKWWHGIFVFSLISVVACIIRTWAPYPYGARMPTEMVAGTDWSNGCVGLNSCICPRETICADDLVSMILLTIARCSAWFDYPLYMCLFLSKSNNLNNYLQKTVLRCKINFSDFHKVHRLFGIIVGIESASHSFFHLLRWARRKDDIQLLWTSRTGITGLVCLATGLLVILPMTSQYLRASMSFEWRKALHYLAVIWAASLMYHAPERIFWLIGIPLLIYLIDKVIEVFFRTFLIESAQFERLGDSICNIVFENPPGFGSHNSAYVYLMLPWISTNQFHAFTVFPGPRPNTSSICISKCGDWSEALMEEIATPTHKPAFVMGPFLSPFSSPAMDSDNLIAVASGIGVTPALSLLKKYSCTTRRMNLIWICRDGALVEHFLQSLDVINGRLLIYYTGNRRLFLNDDLPPDICILKGRPDLEKALSAVIYSVAHELDLPDDLYRRNPVITKATPEQRLKLLLERALSIYSTDQLFDYSAGLTPLQHLRDKGPSGASASFNGVISMMEELLGDEFNLFGSKIYKALDLVDSYGSAMLTKDMFDDFIHVLTKENTYDDATVSTSKITDDLETGSVMSHGNYNIEPLLQSNGKYSSKHWKMLYCGGSNAVLSQLKTYGRKHSIGLSVEKFDW